MQQASAATVLGNFDNAKFAYNGVTSTFFRRSDKFMVRTDGADGKLTDFKVEYTFGIEPLQQYLIEFPGGRLQALSIAWDTRPKEQGGQRWFHLYPGEHINYRDPLHWTRLNQNWNFMCVECHSTNVRRNYDSKTDRFATSWSEINVSCEACHGPGSNHVAWARKDAGWQHLSESKGLTVLLEERRGVTWAADAATGNAARSRPRETRREVETCAQCHSRRAPFADGFEPYGRLMDTHDPSLLAERLYFTDGQQRDEVYNYGSFLQSKMFAMGVTCSDCHDPHTSKLRSPGNEVCAQCHAPAKYDAHEHHLHRAGSAGAQCAACHMPTRNYMVIDARHDHSIRVPRPDLTVRFGTPNACNICHTNRDAKWAAAEIEKAYGPTARKGFQTFVEALHAGRTGAPGAEEKLLALVRDTAAPSIARATAITELQRVDGEGLRPAIEAGLLDKDEIVRGAALDALLSIDPGIRDSLAERLLDDPVKVVRIKAARALAATPLDGLSAEQKARRERAFAEYVASQEQIADRPEAHLNLGLFYIDRRDIERAESEYRTAIRLQPDFVPAYANLADLYRALGRESDAEAVLNEGLKAVPNNGTLLHALGLLRVRQARHDEALALFERSVKASPDVARYAYVYAVALYDSSRKKEAVAALDRALQRFPNDRSLLFARAAFARDAGDRALALSHARHLLAVAPHDVQAAALVKELSEQKN